MMFILESLLLLLGFYLLFYSIFSFFLIAISLPGKQKSAHEFSRENPEILLVLPAYEPSNIFAKVLDAAKAATRGRNIKVYVLLQEADAHHASLARAKGFYVEEQNFSGMKGNSYHHALRHISNVITSGQRSGWWDPKFTMIVDKDNILEGNFFDQIPPSVYNSFDLIQGQRRSLNRETAFAFFDTMSEALNDCMFRTAKQKCGSMIEISGSGMLIETGLFIEATERLDPNAPGFDKNFMVQMLTSARRVRSIFWPLSQLHEEKISDAAGMSKQRLRWFGEQYYNAVFHFRSLVKAFIVKREIAPLDYLITLWRPPRSVQLFVTPFLGLIESAWATVYGYWPLDFPVFGIASLTMAFAIGLFITRQGVVMETLAHSTKLPRLAFSNLFAAARSMKKENRGTFIHTRHKL